MYACIGSILNICVKSDTHIALKKYCISDSLNIYTYVGKIFDNFDPYIYPNDINRGKAVLGFVEHHSDYYLEMVGRQLCAKL